MERHKTKDDIADNQLWRDWKLLNRSEAEVFRDSVLLKEIFSYVDLPDTDQKKARIFLEPANEYHQQGLYVVRARDGKVLLYVDVQAVQEDYDAYEKNDLAEEQTSVEPKEDPIMVEPFPAGLPLREQIKNEDLSLTPEQEAAIDEKLRARRAYMIFGGRSKSITIKEGDPDNQKPEDKTLFYEKIEALRLLKNFFEIDAEKAKLDGEIQQAKEEIEEARHNPKKLQ